MNLLELSEQEIFRRNSMEQLRQMGIEPYPAAEYPTNAFSKEIKASFKDDAEPRQVTIAGRIMSRRIMGKASFMELQDSEGRIQIYISRDDICPDENKNHPERIVISSKFMKEVYTDIQKQHGYKPRQVKQALKDAGVLYANDGPYSYSGTINGKSFRGIYLYTQSKRGEQGE